MAYAPKDLNDFGHYAATVVEHYRRSGPRPVTHYQILNGPVYTSYALPRVWLLARRLPTAAGDGVSTMKKADPNCQVVGGISAGSMRA